MSQRLLLLLLAIAIPILSWGQDLSNEGLSKSSVVTTVRQEAMGPFRADGGPCSIHYMKYNGHALYILRIGSTSSFDDATAVIIGDNLQDAQEWLEVAARVCQVFDVGTFMSLPTKIEWIKEPYGLLKQALNHSIMIGDQHFSGLGEMNERGSSIVFIPDNSKAIGRHGVHKKAFRGLSKQLVKVARKNGLS